VWGRLCCRDGGIAGVEERDAVNTRELARTLLMVLVLGVVGVVAYAQDEVLDENGETAPRPWGPMEPADEVPADDMPVEDVPVDEVPVDEVPVEEPVEELPEEPPVLAPTVPAPSRPMPIRPQPIRPQSVMPSRGTERFVPPPPSSEITSNPSNNLPKEGQTASTPVSFDFDNVQLSTVIEAIARMTGKNFDVDPNIGSIPVTVITHDEIPPELAYQVLESILSTRGFSLMETLDGHLVKVVKTGDAREKTHMGEGADPIPERYDTLQTNVVTVQYANAQDLATILTVLGSSVCRVDSYLPTNTLIINDTADGMRRIASFLEEVDVPGSETEMEIFTLEYTRAEVLADQIDQVLMGGTQAHQGAQAAARTPTTSPVRPTRPTVPGASAPLVIGAREEILRIVSDERLNALIAVATSGMMERVRDLVDRLDTPTPYEANNMHVYELMNADAEGVETALNALVGTQPRKGAEGGTQTGEIQPFEKKVLITRYEQTNALLVLASPQDYNLLREVIAMLDVPTRQVHIQAIILQVEITDNYTLSVETAAFQKDTHGVVGLNNVAKLAEVLTKGPLTALGGSGLNMGYLDGTTQVVIPSADGTLTPVTIPNVPLLLTAIDKMTDLDVLSQPNLTTQDNETAKIIVGQEVPVPTMRSGYSYNPRYSDNTNNYSNLSSYGGGISREDVGVKMTVTPHINEGDYISTEVEIEVSSIASGGEIDVNELGPTFSKSSIENNVVVKDGSTAIIGGLITENTGHSKTQTPVLGDLPLVGWLFGARGTTRLKQNLVVLMTPHIIKEGMELERLTAHRMNEFRDANVDALFEKGFIKKIKKRQYMRSESRPGMAVGEQFDPDAEVFGRGDIKR